jgi:hypothetical protein
MRMRNAEQRMGMVAEQEWQNTEWKTTIAALISSKDLIYLTFRTTFAPLSFVFENLLVKSFQIFLQLANGIRI